jgi:hypothetical protein
MKTVINSSKISIPEFVKRSFYSFQVLMVGISIPVLFIIGISDGNQKKIQKNDVNEVTNTTQQSPEQVVNLNIARI